MLNEQQDSGSTDRCLDNEVFRAIADYTYDWESWHSPDGKLLWVNTAVERMTDYRPEECLKMADYPLSLVADIDRDRIATVLRDAIAGGYDKETMRIIEFLESRAGEGVIVKGKSKA